MKVAVLDTTKKPLAPTTLRRADLLLKRGQAAVFRHHPFTIILKREVSDSETPDLRLKIDPGSKTSGIAIINQQTGEVVFAANLNHQGHEIKKSLDSRCAQRRNRRHRKTRYRKPRFNNRRRPEGWLPPSLESRVENVYTWARRLSRVYPIKGLAMELAKFDMQAMEKPEIKGVEYQRGELAGFERREYLLKQPLKDAAAVNSTRWALFGRLKGLGLPVETGSGGLTKFNRIQRELPKEHWIDAACVGQSTPEKLNIADAQPLQIKATGHGSRQMCLPDKDGFPRTAAKAKRVVYGFRTGDRVRVVVPDGKKKGAHMGKVAVRSSGSFNITTAQGLIQGISHRHCRLLQRADGYSINR